MLIGLVLSLILLFLRQLYMWKDNQALILTYEQLTTQLEDEVEEGAFALSKSEQRYKSLFEDHPDAVFSLNMNGIFNNLIRLAKAYLLPIIAKWQAILWYTSLIQKTTNY